MTEKLGEWVWARDSGKFELTEFELAGFYCSSKVSSFIVNDILKLLYNGISF